MEEELCSRITGHEHNLLFPEMIKSGIQLLKSTQRNIIDFHNRFVLQDISNYNKTKQIFDYIICISKNNHGSDILLPNREQIR